MPAETREAKAARYLTSRRLLVTEVTDDRVTATVTGDTGTWQCGWHPRVRGHWYCRCPAPKAPGRPCVHLVALQAVVPPRADAA